MANNSILTIKRITSLKKKIEYSIYELKAKNKDNLIFSINFIFEHPYFDSNDLREYLNISKPTVSNIIGTLCKLNVVSPTSNKQRYITYKFDEYITILEEGTEI